jgi:hypothetical protein
MKAHAEIEVDTLNAIEGAIGSPVVSFVAMVTYLCEDGGQNWKILDAPEQHIGVGLGQAKALLMFYERQFECALDESGHIGDDE